MLKHRHTFQGAGQSCQLTAKSSTQPPKRRGGRSANQRAHRHERSNASPVRVNLTEQGLEPALGRSYRQPCDVKMGVERRGESLVPGSQPI